MSEILVDSSVWISFLKGDEKVKKLDQLIQFNKICTNELILAELIPSIQQKKEKHLIELFHQIKINPIRLEWNDIIEMQIKNLKNGINKIGIPDLIILQNAVQYETPLFTLDKHFLLMQSFHKIELYQ